jgi:hypothetical protein
VEVLETLHEDEGERLASSTALITTMPVGCEVGWVPVETVAKRSHYPFEGEGFHLSFFVTSLYEQSYLFPLLILIPSFHKFSATFLVCTVHPVSAFTRHDHCIRIVCSVSSVEISFVLCYKEPG